MIPYRTNIPGLKFEIEYQNKEAVEQLLGGVGRKVLDKVLRLANTVSKKQNWPLTKVRIQRYKDYELPSWEYVLVIMVFDTTFEIADEYLHEFCDQIDLLNKKLSDEEQTILRELFSFDVTTTRFLEN